MTRPEYRRLLSSACLLLALIVPGFVKAEEPVCVPYSVEALCLVDGEKQACDLEALPPGASYFLTVDADEAGVVYIATVAADESISLSRHNLAAGDNRFPESGAFEPADGGNFGVVVLTSTQKLEPLAPFVGKTLSAGSKENDTLKSQMVEIFEAHGVCRQQVPPPPASEGMEMEPEPTLEDNFEEEAIEEGGDKGDGKVHVEPELLD